MGAVRQLDGGWFPSAALPAAAVAIALVYVPSLDAPFVEPKLAVLALAGALGLGGATVEAALGARRPRWNRAVRWAVVGWIATTLLAALAAVARGAPGVPYASAELVRLGAVIGVALATAALGAAPGDHRRRLLSEAILAAAALVSTVGLLQHLGVCPLPIPAISVPGSTFGNRNLAAEAVAVALPFGLGLVFLDDRRRAPLAAVLLAIAVAYLVVARARGAWLGGTLGLVVFLAFRRPVLSAAGGWPIAAVVVAAFLAAAVPGRWNRHDALDAKRFAPGAQVVEEALDPTSPVARTRLGLWRRTWRLVGEHPILGLGPGNFPIAFARVAEPDAARDRVLSATVVPRRAHQDFLERWAETGSLGLLALLAVYGAAAANGRRRARAARQADRPEELTWVATGAGALATFAGCGLTGFPAAMPATAFLFGAGLGLLAIDGSSGQPSAAGSPGWPDHIPGAAAVEANGAVRVENARRPFARAMALGGAWILAAAVLAGAATWSGRRIAASYWLARAEAALRVGDAEGALGWLRRAERAAPRDFKVALRASYAALRLGRSAEAATEAARALTIEPDSANGWEALALARSAAGDPRGADVAATRALGLLHDYPGALYSQALAAAALGDATTSAAARARLSDLAGADREASRLLAALSAGAR